MNLQEIFSEEAQTIIDEIDSSPQKALLHITKSLDRILAKEGIEDSEQLEFFENEAKTLLSNDPTGSQLFEEIIIAAEEDNHHHVTQILQEIYDWLNTNYQEIEGL